MSVLTTETPTTVTPDRIVQIALSFWGAKALLSAAENTFGLLMSLERLIPTWIAWRSGRPTWRVMFTPFLIGVIAIATCFGGFSLARGTWFTVAFTIGILPAVLVAQWRALVFALAKQIPSWKPYD